MNDVVLLTTEQMRAAEAAAMAAGVSGAALMEAAGMRASEIIMRAWDQRPVAVLCGPGNNGGDGFVVARRLKEAGWTVRVGLLGDKDALKGDAKLMAGLYDGDVAPLSPSVLENAGLVVDALFGTGLVRPLEGVVLDVIRAVQSHGAPVVAIDIPSGVNADSGMIMGAAFQAARTVTFQYKKPGHVLFPGRALSGVVDTVDIGITPEMAKGVRVDTLENQPAIWAGQFRRPTFQTHKYHRGHVYAVSGGPYRTGAVRLAAEGALRIGAGLVTVISPSDAADENAAHLTAIMLRVANSADEITDVFRGGDKYREVAIIGPGAGVGDATREKVAEILKSTAGAVLDADALTSFSEEAGALFSLLRKDDVITPHAGEFGRLFDGDEADGRLALARRAAAMAGAVVVLKGADTIVAAPDGRAAINVNAPPDLSTAGAGDVLAGFIGGLKAQGMDGFEAACAGVWFHGAAAQVSGPGLIAEDLPRAAPAVLRSLLSPPQPSQPPSQPSTPPGAGRSTS